MGFDNVRRDIRALAILLAASSLLGGCSWFHRHSEKQANEYRTGVQERPLEVPPDLDKPNTAAALTIPEVGSPGAAGCRRLDRAAVSRSRMIDCGLRLRLRRRM